MSEAVALDQLGKSRWDARSPEEFARWLERETEASLRSDPSRWRMRTMAETARKPGPAPRLSPPRQRRELSPPRQRREWRNRLEDLPHVLSLVRVSPTGITIAELARVLYGVDPPSRKECIKAARRLRWLQARGLVTCRPGQRGGDGGRTADVFTA